MAKPQVLFIELKIASKERYICDLTEKFYNDGWSVSIFCSDPKKVTQLDDLLWTWKQESFIPHKIQDTSTVSIEPVFLSSSESILPQSDIIILHDPVDISSLSSYKLVVDFAEVYHNEKRRASRDRFKKMRDSGVFDLHFESLGTVLSKTDLEFNF